MNYRKALGQIVAFQRTAGYLSVFCFLATAPAWNIFFAIGLLFVWTTRSLHGDGFITRVLTGIATAGLLAFPLVLGLVILFYHLALALALFSLRPLPLLLALAAWLSANQYFPDALFLNHGSQDWKYPALYTALGIFSSVWAAISFRKSLG
ncbi:MAG: hypothetical protein FIA97_11030 [Methylococcaceae bacterium]|nr:hypothetical protein [Methylococcaceae bacterium]